jgi:hypothetical protein
VTPDDAMFAPDPSRDAPPRAADCRAVLMPGGGCVLAFSGAGAAPPAEGRARWAGGESAWRAVAWTGGGGAWHGAALLSRLPEGPVEAFADAGAQAHRFARPHGVDVGARCLADLVRATGGDALALARFLARDAASGDGPPPAPAALVAELLVAASEPGGFVELAGAPSGGGLFVQGWSRTPVSGPARAVVLAEGPVEADAVAATFARNDLLAPATGLCLLAPRAAATPSAVRAVFVAAEGRLLRLEAAPGGPAALAGEAAADRLRDLAPRLVGDDDTLRAVRRACRPRFDGRDTLSGATRPVAAAVDLLLRNDAGDLLALGWLLDPEGRVERLLIKGDGVGYAPLHDGWIRLPRPDLAQGFAADPRFAGAALGGEAMHGFLCRAPRVAAAPGAPLHLEVVLADGDCLFAPVRAGRASARDPLPAALCALRHAAVDVEGAVRAHVAPFLDGLARPAAAPAEAAATLGTPPARPLAAAVAPVALFDEAQSLLASLAGTAEAATLDLTLVADRAFAAAEGDRLRRAFAFYGVGGRLATVDAGRGFDERLDAGLARAPDAPWALAWSPAALPRGAGWLAALAAAASGAGAPALVSPLLAHEDDSIRYAGGDGAQAAGYCAASLAGAGTRTAAAGAAEVALVDRALLRRAGGFSGRCFGDRLGRIDLARRLRAAGGAVLWTGEASFWVVEPPTEPPGPPDLWLRRAVDAALLAAGRPMEDPS